jgi:hypothetical protein
VPVINHLAAIAGRVESLASKPDEYFDLTGDGPHQIAAAIADALRQPR